MQRAVEAAEQFLLRTVQLHLTGQNPAEHHHRNGRLHGVAGRIGHAEDEFAVAQEILEIVSAYLRGRRAAAGDAEPFDPGAASGHQRHLHLVGGFQLFLQRLLAAVLLAHPGIEQLVLQLGLARPRLGLQAAQLVDGRGQAVAGDGIDHAGGDEIGGEGHEDSCELRGVGKGDDRFRQVEQGHDREHAQTYAGHGPGELFALVVLAAGEVTPHCLGQGHQQESQQKVDFQAGERTILRDVRPCRGNLHSPVEPVREYRSRTEQDDRRVYDRHLQPPSGQQRAPGNRHQKVAQRRSCQERTELQDRKNQLGGFQRPGVHLEGAKAVQAEPQAGQGQDAVLPGLGVAGPDVHAKTQVDDGRKEGEEKIGRHGGMFKYSC